MKKLYSFVSMLFVASLAFGQYYYNPAASGNPSNLNQENAEYPYGSGLPAGWAINLNNSSSPVWSIVQNLPFEFVFNGDTVNHYIVSSTGIMTFDTATAVAAPSFTFMGLPSAMIPDHSLCLWGIEASGSNDKVVSKTFGNAPNREFWVFFTSMSGPGTSWSYWSIVLHEGTNEISFVDQRHSGSPSMTIGIQIDTAEAYTVAGSPGIQALAGGSETSDDNWYYRFIEGTQPTHDMSAIEIDMYDVLMISHAPYDVKGNFQNFGSDTLQNIRYSYSIDGGTPVSAISSGSNLGFSAIGSFEFSSDWTPAATGVYELKMWTDTLDGVMDMNPSNDTVSLMITVIDTLIQRIPFYETFTSSTCGPCTPANLNMEDLFDNAVNIGNLTSLKYQMSWPGSGDPYYTGEGNTRRAYYGINSVPWVCIDGGWNQNGNNLTQGIINAYSDVQTYLAMQATYSVAPNAVHVDVQINPFSDYTSANNTLFVAIFEYRTENNIKSNGETEFFHVMKKMLPNAGGTAVGAMTNGVPVMDSFDYTFKGNYRLPNNANDPISHGTEHSVEDFNNLGVVVWVQDMGTGEVHQSAYASLVASIGDLDESLYQVYPNPATNHVNVELATGMKDVRIEIVNLLGQPVYETSLDGSAEGVHTINTSALESGIYFVQVISNGKVGTKKIIIQ